ncbi:MAG: ABC transporter ATP-binding protein [Chloroflexota bacterium]|nr:ABC transporter ATP-binding protein [Chloroflexota bacterium]
MSGYPLLAVEDLTMHYQTRAGEVCAVDGVSLSLERGQSLGLVGESGCGKSSLALALLRLQPENAQILRGKVLLDGVDLVSLSEEEMRTYRWNRIAMVFQSAMNALDPVYRVGDQIIEALEQHSNAARQDMVDRVGELYKLVNLSPNFIQRYPHEYSGGMKQRAIIAMALACEPDLIIADEPTTALDVIVQDHILREFGNIRKELNMSMLYISHDMAVIAEVSDVVAVMYAGKIVEYGTAEEVFNKPIHPYTRALMSAFPSVTGEKHELATLGGEPPNPLDLPSGCHFHPRCPFATDMCAEQEPPTVRRGDRWADCWNPPED